MFIITSNSVLEILQFPIRRRVNTYVPMDAHEEQIHDLQTDEFRAYMMNWVKQQEKPTSGNENRHDKSLGQGKHGLADLYQITHQVPVGKGLSGALQLLKARGLLNDSVDNNDDGSQRFKDIRIERTDEFGRLMTPKDSFRELSHKFDCKCPGKRKQEKRQKQYYQELKLKKMKNSDTPSLSVERMREAQAQLKTPYLVLSGHVKPGEAGDPISGFGTVEKDLPGGLTPMLGDKKVEHFLGIKRRAEPGNSRFAKKT